ncbi:MAG: helicase-related protein [Xenococcaceae cyanobacterium]
MTITHKPGSIVTCRDRTWVVLPSDLAEIIRLRPLAGNESEVCGIFTRLEQNIRDAEFPLPNLAALQDHTAGQLLLEAARLSLRSGAGPFRCLGRLSVSPRPYQLVPLLMALRLETVRMLIADDVGIGKTVEAGLIARELIDRAEIKRLAILCPPQLCDQWQQELKQKFNIEAVVIRSGTVGKLERQLPSRDSHVFSYFPHIIVSLDYAKSDRRRASFLAHCPDLIIVDEAHTASNNDKDGAKQQQRYQLVKQIAEKSDRHLILLTATPHSGISASFLSLLGLIKPELESYQLDNLNELQRKELARHFVQRRRADVRSWLGNETPFPERESLECAYKLSPEYRTLFEQVYNLARGLVKDGDSKLSHAQRRGRYWSALAIVRCVMSSPAAAISTLSRQLGKDSNVDATEEIDEELSANQVYDSTESERVIDIAPTSVVEKVKQTYSESQRRKLREFVKVAGELRGSKQDSKLQSLIGLVKDLLAEGYNPIIWCRYIATANYVADALRDKLENKKNSQIRVIPITGEQSEDEREIRLKELKDYSQRVMVATDCLSEGVNLQEHFTAVVHYDLPWNPNRLEQREGRIDRYGQTATKVKCILLYGQDNPVDGAVLDVLIRKAVKIHRALGITVPVPMDSNTVQEAVFKSLFEKVEAKQSEFKQLSLDLVLQETPVVEVNQSWDRAVEREKQNRTRFAQRAIKPEEVRRELEESERILGDRETVEHFVINACERLNTPLTKKKNHWYLSTIPRCLRSTLGDRPRFITFTSPAPFGVEYIGRNHPLVEGLARYLLEEAISPNKEPTAARCGVTVTDVVDKPTVIFLFRLRHILESHKHSDLLAEECLVRGFTGLPSNPQWLSQEETLELMAKAEPTDDLPLARKQLTVERLLSYLSDLNTDLKDIAHERAEALKDSHRRVRAITKEGQVKVKPQLPMDILGVYYLLPE